MWDIEVINCKYYARLAVQGFNFCPFCGAKQENVWQPSGVFEVMESLQRDNMLRQVDLIKKELDIIEQEMSVVSTDYSLLTEDIAVQSQVHSMADGA